MAVIKVPTTFNIDVEFEIPEFYRRLVALLIDVVIQYCYLRIAIEIFKVIARNSDFTNSDTGYDLNAVAVLLLLPLLLSFFEFRSRSKHRPPPRGAGQLPPPYSQLVVYPIS